MLEFENLLSKNQFFSKNCLPGKADALMFQIFDTECMIFMIKFPKNKNFLLYIIGT